jgi:hypothetical protein
MEGKEGSLRCEVCDVAVSQSEKAWKQHLKSITHKRNQSGKQKRKPKHREKRVEVDEEEEVADTPCLPCKLRGYTHTRHSLEAYRQCYEAGEDVFPCFPPPFYEV